MIISLKASKTTKFACLDAKAHSLGHRLHVFNRISGNRKNKRKCESVHSTKFATHLISTSHFPHTGILSGLAAC